ncbi:MAG: anti-sigma F factor [Clostridia bacterium]|nr:anti-sigma F factor [Clostridia bacterium]MBQ2691627.1 anti-sigma F factor [Clostridia bacterium]MBQ3062530.1 anti-sigma F factor [Clostridia bacterium]MBQ9966284.1 anti-sigma F factor [Clostridia bacterium]
MRNELNRVVMRFPSKSINEGLARSGAAAFASQLDPTLDELGDIRTAVSEAVTNAIVHGYKDEIGEVIMTMKLFEGDEIEIVISDKGCGIPDIDQARQPLYTTGGAERSGMGFTIMESFMDSLKIKSAEGKGTTVTMRKRLNTRRYR